MKLLGLIVNLFFVGLVLATIWFLIIVGGTIYLLEVIFG